MNGYKLTQEIICDTNRTMFHEHPAKHIQSKKHLPVWTNYFQASCFRKASALALAWWDCTCPEMGSEMGPQLRSPKYMQQFNRGASWRRLGGPCRPLSSESPEPLKGPVEGSSRGRWRIVPLRYATTTSAVPSDFQECLKLPHH